jgi:hypothetical protein
MKYLIVNSDDFGMCHSANIGIVEGFKKGILTQSTLMAPCPWFEEAVSLAKKHKIPVGVHLTATCDWDLYRWKPLTSGRSLIQKDGSFFHSIKKVQRNANPKELEAEFSAQIELVLARGIKPSHIDPHMGLINADITAKICRKYKIFSRYPLGKKYKDCMFHFDSHLGLSGMGTDKKKPWLRNYLKNLSDGYHFLCVHLAAANPEMGSVCSRPSLWAQEYRVSDLNTIIDPEIKALCRKLDIHLISLKNMATRNISHTLVQE